jgi:hypothetical protein
MNPVTRKQLSTYYVLGLDFAAPPIIEFAVSQSDTRIFPDQNKNIEPNRVSNCDMVPVSQKQAIPCVKNGHSRVSNCDTNLVIEPVREPQRLVAAVFSEFWSICPKPRNEVKSRELFLAAVEAGTDPADIVSAARAYALDNRGAERRYVAGSDSWLAKGRWSEHAPAASAAPAASKFATPAAFYADWVKSGRSVPASAINPSMARELLGRGLVTEADLRNVGVTS